MARTWASRVRQHNVAVVPLEKAPLTSAVVLVQMPYDAQTSTPASPGGKERAATAATKDHEEELPELGSIWFGQLFLVKSGEPLPEAFVRAAFVNGDEDPEELQKPAPEAASPSAPLPQRVLSRLASWRPSVDAAGAWQRVRSRRSGRGAAASAGTGELIEMAGPPTAAAVDETYGKPSLLVDLAESIHSEASLPPDNAAAAGVATDLVPAADARAHGAYAPVAQSEPSDATTTDTPPSEADMLPEPDAGASPRIAPKKAKKKKAAAAATPPEPSGDLGDAASSAGAAPSATAPKKKKKKKKATGVAKAKKLVASAPMLLADAADSPLGSGSTSALLGDQSPLDT